MHFKIKTNLVFDLNFAFQDFTHNLPYITIIKNNNEKYPLTG